ncbi:TonB-dependent receptor plug domain-containing protein [Aliikangiella maris]|uniref:TonB-dependent receptor n=2 Tax=Aliikangiella maris TaxID=3162458 RepID=A0ABV3MI19_9GAMM
MTAKPRSLILFLFIHFILSPISSAQEVSENEYDLADFYGDEEFVSIATGSKKSISKAPAVASVITAKDIRRIGATNLAEVLEQVPGLHVSRSGQNFVPEFWFRGITSTFNPQTLIMINGVSTKSVVRGDNHTVWGQFPIHGIERIEIIRGPGSALYGADAFSGVINIITKGSEEPFNNEAGIMYGSFNTKNIWSNNQFTLADWNFALTTEYIKSKGFEGLIEEDTQTIFDRVAATLNLPAASQAPGFLATSFEALDIWMSANNTWVNLQAGLQKRSDIGTGQGGTEALDKIGRLGNYKKIFKISLNEVEVLPQFSLGGNISYYGSSQEIEKDMVLFPPGAFFGSFPDGFIGNPGWEEETTHATLTATYRQFNQTEISFGAGYDRQNLYKVVEEKNFYPDFSPRPGGIEDVSDTAEVYMPEADRESHFFYTQLISQIAPDWELTAGARYDHYTDFGSTINPRIALVWSSSLNLTTKFLYGKAFRAPAFAESLVVNNPIALGNPTIKPETIDTLEVAFNYNYSPELSLDFNLYHYEIEDFITFILDENGVTATAQNIGKRSGKGFESGLNYHWSESFDISANIAYVNAKDKLLDSKVPDYPDIQFYLNADWHIADKWKWNGQLFYIGERERMPTDPREDLQDYLQFNMVTSYQSADNFLIEFIVANLFDEEICEPSGASTTLGQIQIPNDLPQAGRAVYLRASLQY